MFNRYDTKIKYVSKQEKTDMFGYSSSEPVDKAVRYVGGKEVNVSENNAFRSEHRLVYQAPFEVSEGDKFITDKEHVVMQSERVCDIFGKTVYWEVQIV